MAFRIAPSILSADFARLGDEVRAAFLARDAAAASAFRAVRPGHWLLDLYAVARQRLAASGVTRMCPRMRCDAGRAAALSGSAGGR